MLKINIEKTRDKKRKREKKREQCIKTQNEQNFFKKSIDIAPPKCYNSQALKNGQMPYYKIIGGNKNVNIYG